MAAKIEDLATALAAANSPFALQHFPFNSAKEGAADLVSRLHALESKVAASEAKITALEAKLATTPPTGAQS